MAKQLNKQVVRNQWGKYHGFEDECFFEGLDDWLAPALPALQLQQRHRAVPVRGEDGHWPPVQPCSTLLPYRQPLSPVPVNPRGRAEPVRDMPGPAQRPLLRLYQL